MLHHQSAVLFDKIQPVEEDEWDDDHAFGWESEYDDEAFFFTQSVLDGDADEMLTNLFDERVRRDEGAPSRSPNCCQRSRTLPTMPKHSNSEKLTAWNTSENSESTSKTLEDECTTRTWRAILNAAGMR